MNLHELKYNEGAKASPKRKGRGVGSTLGKTSGKGHKGQRARSGRVRIGFEGGQTPLYRRLPKKGFSNFLHSKKYATINIEKFDSLRAGSIITLEVLKEKGLITTKYNTLKVLGRGPLEKRFTVRANQFSKTAIEAIENAGGKVEVV